MVRKRALWPSGAARSFCSAFLLFQVQPVLAKIILPWFGGGAGVWTTSLVFFQVTYLLGNLYAHGLMRLRNPLWPSRVHAGCSPRAFSCYHSAGVSWKPAGNSEPALRILAARRDHRAAIHPFVRDEPASTGVVCPCAARQQAYRFYAFRRMRVRSLAAELSRCLSVLIRPLATRPWLGPASTRSLWLLRMDRVPGRTASPTSKDLGKPSPDWKTQLLMGCFGGGCFRSLVGHDHSYLARCCGGPAVLDCAALALSLEPDLCFDSDVGIGVFYFPEASGRGAGGNDVCAGARICQRRPLIVQIPLYCAGLFICCMVCTANWRAQA